MKAIVEWDSSHYRVLGTSGDKNTSEATEEAIRGVGELPDGWEFGVGRGADDETVDRALLLYRTVAPLYPNTVEVAPGVEGGIKLTFVCASDTFLDVDVRPDGFFDWTVEKGIGAAYTVLDEKHGISFADAISRIISRYRQASRYRSRWHSCGLFTPTVTPALSDASTPTLFRTMVRESH